MERQSTFESEYIRTIPIGLYPISCAANGESRQNETPLTPKSVTSATARSNS